MEGLGAQSSAGGRHGLDLIVQVGFRHAQWEGGIAGLRGALTWPLALYEWSVVRVGVQKGLESQISLNPR